MSMKRMVLYMSLAHKSQINPLEKDVSMVDGVFE